MRFFCRIFFFVALFGLAGCGNSPKQAKLRIVDLQGNPRNVQMRTPELNIQALASQGNLSEEKIQAQPRKVDAAPEQQVANNKYANKDFGASSTDAIKNTLQMPTNPQPTPPAAAPEVNEADILIAGNGAKNKDRTIEYTLNKKNIMPATTADNQGAVAKKQKGIFVQTGSFTVLQHANNSLTKIENLAGKSSTVVVEEAQNNDKTVYRVLIGPFSSKPKANAMIAKLAKSGQQAIIVKK